jgi:hypothetical protein
LALRFACNLTGVTSALAAALVLDAGATVEGLPGKTDKYAGEWAGDLIDQIAVSKHYGHGAQA